MYSSGANPLPLELVHLRVSQINACGACVSAGVTAAKKHAETDERLHQVAAWRELDLFTDTERSVLALAEAATRMADRPDAVSDDVWNVAAAGPPRRATTRRRRGDGGTDQLLQPVNATIREPAGKTWD
jgi:AhpD family alkylhydroperoxidase